MLNFENPAPEEDFENGKEVQSESDDLFSSQKVEFPRSFHHAADSEVKESWSAPAGKEPETGSGEEIVPPAVAADEAEHAVPAPRPAARRKPVSVSDARKAETSRILIAARNAAGLTQVDVEARTRVRAYYVEALENGNFDQLPQQVYVLAYLRRLAELYGITGDDLEALLEPWKDISCVIPENLPASVYPDPDNPNRKTLRQLEITLYAAGAIVLIAVFALIIMLVSSWLSGTRKAGNPPFDREVLLELQNAPKLTAPAQPKAK